MKVNLRDLFWLLLVIGLACGWYLDRTRAVLVIDSQREELASTKASLKHSQELTRVWIELNRSRQPAP